MRKNPFQIVFDPSRQPGFETRNVSLQKFQGGAGINPSQPSGKRAAFFAPKVDLVKKFNSGQVWQTLPSAKGKRS